MEYFYGGGGNSNPDFIYRFLVREITTDMWKWCEAYPLTGPFERWHIKRNGNPRNDNVDRKEIPMIQFESRKAAYLFSIAYSEYIIENKSIYDITSS